MLGYVFGFAEIHHSPQRIEVIASFYKHPGEMIVNSVIGSVLVYTVFCATCGFVDAQEHRRVDMLLYRDVHER